MAGAAPPVVFIEKCKRPDGRGLWPAYEVAHDEFGTWLYTPRGSIYRWQRNDDVGFCNVGSPTGPGHHVLSVIPDDDWWIATFWPREIDISCWITVDVCTPPVRTRSVWSYVDLELDPWLDSIKGTSGIADEDEFEAALIAGWISSDEETAALEAASRMRGLLS